MTASLHDKLSRGATVVTPNQRLSRHIKENFDRAQLRAGKRAWIAGDVLPWSAWLERSYSMQEHRRAGAMLMAPPQELALWRLIVSQSSHAHALLDLGSMARLARDAWALQYAWRVDFSARTHALSDDALAYRDWAIEFETQCRDRNWIARASVADLLAVRAREGEIPDDKPLVLYAFDALTAQERDLLDRYRACGMPVEMPAPASASAQCRRRIYPTTDDEMTGVARRVRALLEADPNARIGVVVPDLSVTRERVIRVFDDVLDPGRILQSNPTSARAYNLSLGVPLSHYALVRAALSILRLAGKDLSLQETGALLLGPFIGGAERELGDRALLDAQLRKQGNLCINLEQLTEFVAELNRRSGGRCAILKQKLPAFLSAAVPMRRKRQLPSAWIDGFLALLSLLGWPGERTLNSEEYQAAGKFREVVKSLSWLDAVEGAQSFGDTLSWLSRTLSDTPFQAESHNEPVQVLGVLESAGIAFDHLFVVGLHDEAWPFAPRPNPLLPVSVQRACDMPHASASWEAGFAQRMMSLWRNTSQHLTYSCAIQDGDLLRRPSRLIAGIDDAQDESQTAWVSYARSMHGATKLETTGGDPAPSLPPVYEAVGGAAVLHNQAACPFRAFAIHRLGALPLEIGRLGLDARERGALLHKVLALFYSEVPSQSALLALSAQALEEILGHCLDRGLAHAKQNNPSAVSPAFSVIERRRLRALLAEFFEMEKKRAPFEVAACEEPRIAELDGLQLKVRIDRIDKLSDGRRVVLDYKTGKASTSGWWDERLDEPQLPLYAITDMGEVAAVSFAQLRADKVAFKGVAQDDGLLPGVSPLRDGESWPAFLGAWRKSLDRLAREFLAGHAAVDPKKYPSTCQYCHIGPLCRVKEVLGTAATDEEAPDE
ncbi:MAG: PD-(D/E)XK nuclease family protein [Burkholderiales bacterium]